MTARTWPESPTFTTTSEQLVFEALRDALGPDDVVLTNLRLTDARKDHEADLVVLLPDHGLVVLEVKGGPVWLEDGRWMVRRSGRPARVHPVDQARDAKYSLREYVERDPRWRDTSRSRVAWSHGVVTPHQWFGDEDQPDLPRWMLHAEQDLPDIAQRVRRAARDTRHGQRVPDLDDVELVAEILTGRRTTSYDVNAEAAELEDRADRLTQEQAMVLGVTRLLHRIEVRGGAGSGKTVLALAQARDLQRGRADRKPQRVALLCYSIGLAEYFKRETASWPHRQRPSFVGTFEELGRLWGVEGGDRQDSDFWENRLPATMSDLAQGLPDGQRFDAVIVDEAQDFAESWWHPLLSALRDEEGGLFVYSDENQRIFGRFGRPPVALVPLVLDHNLRNTRQIHQVFDPLAPSRMRSVGGDGPSVRFVAATVADAVGAADDEVDRLLDDGWRPEHVMLLTTGPRHPVQKERTGPADDQRAYWQTYWEDDDVFYGHVLGCKGMERRAVVLCVNQADAGERSRERLYVGLSRATHTLVVVGDPDVVRAMGGDDVAQRLGLAR